MKHRSVIAFVIVAAALFSLPQLSHDLYALKGAVGARLQSELLHAFLNLPAGDPVAAEAFARPAETLLATCTQSKSGGGAHGGRAESNGRAKGRTAGRGFEQSAMIVDPAHDPINQVAGVLAEKVVDEIVPAQPHVRVGAEVAMIVPPENGIDPRGIARALAPQDVARAEADGLRVVYAAAARLQEADPEWQKAAGDALRKLDGSLPAGSQLRFVREGAKMRVLKLKCVECPSTLPRAPRPAPAAVPQPAPSAPVEWASE